jgi:hypothetical protein
LEPTVVPAHQRPFYELVFFRQAVDGHGIMIKIILRCEVTIL